MHPFFHIGGREIAFWDLFYVISFAAVLFTAMLFYPKGFVISRLKFFFVVVLFFVVATFGAEVLSLLLTFHRSNAPLTEKDFASIGMAYLGAPVFGFFFLAVLCGALNISFLAIADFGIVLLMLERVIGRIGCLLSGCCYGIECNLPWAYPFTGAIFQHPTQAYEFSYAFGIFLSSLYLYKNARNLRGLTLCYGVFCYSFLRFFNEFLRAEGPFAYGMIKYSHIALAILAVVTATGIVIIVRKSAEKSSALIALRRSFIRLLAWTVLALILILSFISFSRNLPYFHKSSTVVIEKDVEAVNEDDVEDEDEEEVAGAGID